MEQHWLRNFVGWAWEYVVDGEEHTLIGWWDIPNIEIRHYMGGFASHQVPRNWEWT